MDPSEKFLLTALASIGDGVITTDAQGQVVFLNAVAESLTGWNLAEAVGEPLDVVFRIVNETTHETVESPVTRALREGGIVGLANHTILLAKDGAERPVDDSAAPIRNERDEIVGCVLVFRDVTERRKAERANAQLAAIVADSDDAIISKTLEGVILSWNAAAERLYGYSAAEAVGQPIDLIVPDECRDEEHEIREKLRSGQRVDHYETVRVARDGRRIHVSLTISPLRDAYGRVVGASNVSRDISERKRAERQQRERDAQLRLMADSAPALIWVSDAQKKGIFFNKRWLSFAGRTLEQELGDGWLKGIHPEDVDRVAATYLDAFNGCKPFEMEFRLRRADGQYRWMLDQGVPRLTEGGALAGYIGSCIDLTDKHEAEQALLESQQRHLLALDAGGMGAWEWSLETNKVIWSPTLEAIHGLEPGAFPGTYDAYWNDVHPEDRQRVQESIQRTLETGEDHHIVYRIKWPDDSVHTLEARGKLVRDEAGQPARMIGVCTDITTRVKAERRLREEDRRKDEFIAILAHELRNPLAALSLALEVMKGLDADPRLGPIREMMERQSRQLIALIDDLLEISRITRGKLELRRVRVTLADIVQSAIETARPAIDQARHHLSVEVPDEELEVEGDPHRLSQVLSNLLCNAAKFTPDGGQIQLTLERQGDEAVLAVRDSGIGIPAAMQEKIFDMFAQAANPLDRGAAGLGVGLTLAKRLVELHGGTIELHSEGVGKGSEFRVQLPLALMPANETSPDGVPNSADASPGVAGMRRRRVLIVDDNLDAAEMLGLLAEELGSEVCTAADGAQAIEIAADFRPEIVLMDLGMPRMNGYDAAAHIRNQGWGKEMMLVALTGWGQEKDRQRIIEAGFDLHLVKPARPEQLRALLGSPLQSPPNAGRR